MTPATGINASPPPATAVNIGAGCHPPADDLDRMPLSKRPTLLRPTGPSSSPRVPSNCRFAPIDLAHKRKHHRADSKKWPGLPRGVKFVPSDRDLLWHLLAKIGKGRAKPHPFISDFITCLDEVEGFCYTHPQKLPGVKNDGSASYFFHKPFKTFNAHNGKCQKIQNYNSSNLCWHEIDKPKRIIVDRRYWGYKKIMGLFMNIEKDKNPVQTYWVMHQYHLDRNADADSEFFVSKIFYQVWLSNKIPQVLTQNVIKHIDGDIEPMITPKPRETELHEGNQRLDCGMTQPADEVIFTDHHDPKDPKFLNVSSTDSVGQILSQGDAQVPTSSSNLKPCSEVEGHLIERNNNLLPPTNLPSHFAEVKVENSDYSRNPLKEHSDTTETFMSESENNDLDHVSLFERQKMLLSSYSSSSSGLSSYSGHMHCASQPSSSNSLHPKFVRSVPEINSLSTLETVFAKDFLRLLQDISSGSCLENDINENNEQELRDESNIPHREPPWRECCIPNVLDSNNVNSTNNLIVELSDSVATGNSLVVSECSLSSLNCQRNHPANSSFSEDNSQTDLVSPKRISGARNLLLSVQKKQVNRDYEPLCLGVDSQMIDLRNGAPDGVFANNVSEAKRRVQFEADESDLSGKANIDIAFVTAPCSSENFCYLGNGSKRTRTLGKGEINNEGLIQEHVSEAKNLRKQKNQQKNVQDSLLSISNLEVKAEPLKSSNINTVSDATAGKGNHVKDCILTKDNSSQGNISNDSSCSRLASRENISLSSIEFLSDIPSSTLNSSLSKDTLIMKTEPVYGGLPISCRNFTTLPVPDVSEMGVKRELVDELSKDPVDNIQFLEENNMLAAKCFPNSDCDKTVSSSNQARIHNLDCDPKTSTSAPGNCSSLRRKRKKTATNSVETALEEDAPGLLQVLLDKGILVEEIKLYGATDDDDDEAIETSSTDDSFEELENVITKLFSARESLLKLSMARHVKGSKAVYCLACLISLIEQTRYLQFRSSPVEWGWCRELQSFIFVFERHNRIVLERPEYGYATYFFELVDSLPIDWQIKRLVTAMKLSSCSRSTLIENKPLLVGEDLTEGEARVLEDYGWTPNCGLGTMLNYSDRVVHDKKNERFSSEWRSKIGRLLMEGHDGGRTVLVRLPKKVAKYVSNRTAEIKLESDPETF